MGECGQRNCNAYKPTTFGGYALLGCSYFPCGFAIVLIGAHILGYYYAFVFGLLAEHGGETAARVLYTVAMTTGTFCCSMVVISYLRTVLTAPGYVPAEPWAKQPIVVTDRETPPTHHDHFVSTVTHRRELRFCRRCSQFKPDDAHHCSQCQKCVFRMDHHCPWVNNCVGRDNTKFFILFLCWLGFSCIYLLLQIFAAYFYLPIKFDLHSAGSHMGIFVLTIGLGIFGVFMTCFGVFHLHLVLSGNSTLGEVMDHQPKSAQFREVFGSPPYRWHHFVPFAPVNRRPRNRPNVGMPQTASVAIPSGSNVGAGAGSPFGKPLPPPSFHSIPESAINDSNSHYLHPTPRPLIGHPEETVEQQQQQHHMASHFVNSSAVGNNAAAGSSTRRTTSSGGPSKHLTE